MKYLLLVQSDSTLVDVLTNADMLSFYQDIMDRQATQFSIWTVVLSIVFTAVVGATWWWNYRGARLQITSEIEDKVKELDKRYEEFINVVTAFDSRFSEFKNSTTKEIEDSIEIKSKEAFDRCLEEYKDDIKILSDQQSEQLKSLKEKLDKRIRAQQAAISRVFALHCSSTGDMFNSFEWWISAVEHYSFLSSNKFTQISVNSALEALRSVTSEDVEDHDVMKNIERVGKVVPPVFHEEREEMTKLLKNLT